MARMYTQVEVDELLRAQEERFNTERVFLNRLVDMHVHKNAQYQKIMTTMSAEIIKKNKRIGQADGEIVSLKQALGLLLGTRSAPAHPLSCSMQASRSFCP